MGTPLFVRCLFNSSIRCIKRCHELALAFPKIAPAGEQTIARYVFSYHVIALQLVIILAIRNANMPDRLRMHGNDHFAIKNINLKHVTVLLP